MQERTRDDGFEATFVVSTPRDLAWKRLTDATPLTDQLPGPEEGQWWIPAIEGAAEEIAIDEGRRLHTRKLHFPCEGTEILITLEDADTGTRITVCQFGFGEGFEEQRPWLATGWAAIVADFVVFFEQGVALGRHLTMWSSIGCEVRQTPSGLEVGPVDSEGLAEQAGLQPGDLIVRLAYTPVLTIRDLAVLVRGPVAAGVETKVHYLRNGEVRSGTGVA